MQNVARPYSRIGNGRQFQFASGGRVVGVDITVIVVPDYFIYAGVKVSVVVNRSFIGPIAD